MTKTLYNIYRLTVTQVSLVYFKCSPYYFLIRVHVFTKHFSKQTLKEFFREWKFNKQKPIENKQTTQDLSNSINIHMILS